MALPAPIIGGSFGSSFGQASTPSALQGMLSGGWSFNVSPAAPTTTPTAGALAHHAASVTAPASEGLDADDVVEWGEFQSAPSAPALMVGLTNVHEVSSRRQLKKQDPGTYKIGDQLYQVFLNNRGTNKSQKIVRPVK